MGLLARAGKAFLDHSAKRGVLWSAGGAGLGGGLSAYAQGGDTEDVIRAALLSAALGGSAASAGIPGMAHASFILGVPMGALLTRNKPGAAERRAARERAYEARWARD